MGIDPHASRYAILCVDYKSNCTLINVMLPLRAPARRMFRTPICQSKTSPSMFNEQCTHTPNMPLLNVKLHRKQQHKRNSRQLIKLLAFNTGICVHINDGRRTF